MCFDMPSKESLWLVSYVKCKIYFNDEDQSLAKASVSTGRMCLVIETFN